MEIGTRALARRGLFIFTLSLLTACTHSPPGSSLEQVINSYSPRHSLTCYQPRRGEIVSPNSTVCLNVNGNMNCMHPC